MNCSFHHHSSAKYLRFAIVFLLTQVILFTQPISILAGNISNKHSIKVGIAVLEYKIMMDGNDETKKTPVSNTAVTSIQINKPGINGIEVYNLLTPNGDGSNDIWVISGIEEYPENSVQIFSRWGNKIRDFKGYDNKDVVWDGTNQKNEILPAGTYFYLLEIKNLGVKKGYIYLTNPSK